MSATYQEAWGLFHAEQDPKPQFSGQHPSASPFPVQGNADDISQSSSPAYLAPAINHPDSRDAGAPVQASSLDMVKELQRLRQDLHQLQFPNSESGHNESSHVRPGADTMSNSSLKVAGSRFDSNTASADSIQRPQHTNNGRFQCWEACCNGRHFSNKSNFIRHQRERRGESCKLRCSFCDAVFSRSSARNAHEASRRCRKQ
ncbi:hypothetical protein FQN49_000962 [Arthroderma sp. PD_2]|nr:hypothetical protein FQN49_000962 [Arthroderma sp. PD_2]